jgi:excinuclease ABC subunit C
VEEADVFALHQEGGFFCVQVFFFRTGQNWGNRAYFPKADRSLDAGEVLGAFLAQFYDDKPPPRLILVSHAFAECELLAQALSAKSSRKVEVTHPTRGEKKELVDHALANAREALGRKLADTSSQRKLLAALAECFALPRPPRRIEVYDNSHIQGTNAVGAMIVGGPEGFRKNQYRKFNIRSADLTPGDDFAMMREVLERRFKRLIAEAPRESVAPNGSADERLAPLPSPLAGEGGEDRRSEPGEGEQDDREFRTHSPDALRASTSPLWGEGETAARAENTGGEETGDDIEESPWPDLVIIDGGRGQLSAAQETLATLGLTDIPLVGVAKGPDRDAGRETFHMAGREPFMLKPRDPVLYFIQRLRDEAHRFAIGSHRARRKKDLREAGLQEIPGIGPTRKRALLQHFGTLKAIERASVADLAKVPGVSAETARKIYDFFHDRPH